MDSIETTQWEEAVLQGGYSDAMPMKCVDTAIGGDMGSSESDFEVTEIPAYMPCGTGNHLYLWVEKRGKSTQDVTRAIERAFGVREIDVGCAGKKDVHAITRQWISVQYEGDGRDVIDALNEKNAGFRILKTSRHTNKLRMGHLIGNRFSVKLYGVTADDAAIARSCARMMDEGFLNYFGRQRFGFDGSNVAQGIRILCGGRANHQMKKLYISALQSAIFNLNLGRRYLESGETVYQGDVMQKMNSGCFICDDPETDNARVKRREIVITLGLPGKKIMRGRGRSLAQEDAVLEAFQAFWSSHDDASDLDISQLSRFADGARRSMWVFPENVSFERMDDDGARLDFALPSGCYATVFLRQLCGSSFTR